VTIGGDTAHLDRGDPFVTVVTRAEERLAIDRCRARGGIVQTTFALPAEPWDLRSARMTCIAGVEGADDAAAALMCALRGVDVVAVMDAAAVGGVSRGWSGADEFLADLCRLGTRRSWDGGSVAAPAVGSVERPAAAGDAGGPLSADQQQILELLADGCSLPEVAAQLFLSLRTAERRLSAARRLLGVRSTAEALAAVTAGAS
jgi:DNA-binding NarL/FixJ family response regulator